MQLLLTSLPKNNVKGIYDGRLATRMLFLAPNAAIDFLIDLAPWVTVSDMFRSAAASLKAIQTRAGAAAPGRSGHNFGYSIDVDVTASMAAIGLKTKREFDIWMKERNWYCHRTDHVLGLESWHYNYFVPEEVTEFDVLANKYTSHALESKILEHWGASFILTPQNIQLALRSLRLYDGEIDGKLGPISQHATQIFQRTWNLTPDGIAGTKTQRLLAYVTAVPQLIPLPVELEKTL